MEPTITIIVAVIGSTGLWETIRYIMESRRKAKFDIEQAVQGMQKDLAILADNQDQMKHLLTKTEKDSVRTQLLVLMSDYPDNKSEIMGVAQHYFDDIGGNWYMTSMFNKWLEREQIGKPDWFKG